MQITGLPTTTTVNASTEFAVENSGITYKTTTSAIAETVKTLSIEDTGWVSISPLNGVTVGGVFQVRRRNGVVYITGQNLYFPASSASSGITIGQLASQFYPATRWDISPALPFFNGAFYILLRPTGEISLVTTSTNALNNIFFASSYLPAN